MATYIAIKGIWGMIMTGMLIIFAIAGLITNIRRKYVKVKQA